MSAFFLEPGLHPGDSLLTQNLGPHREAFDGPASRFVAVILDSGPTDRALAALESCRAMVEAARAYVFAALGDFDGGERFPWVRFLRGGDLARAFGAGPEGLWAIADPMLRVVALGTLADRAEMDRRLEGLAALAAPPAPAMSAPILILPDTLEPELCRALIAAFDREGGVRTGFMQNDGKSSVERLDDGWKTRRDVMLSNPSLVAAVRARIGRRVCPEIRKAFQFVATRTERDLVACYDAEAGGHFGQHRDDTGPLVAHRRFALSIPLNDDFEGGGLTFPEFGPSSLKPAAGAAVVFSCSLLHKVEPVTRGNRYAFLTFLHDEAAEKVRLANLKAAGPGVVRDAPFSQARAAQAPATDGAVRRPA
jgi:hypothetical protein